MKFNELFSWQQGRQMSGYDKMLLAGARWPIKFDMYLLRFKEEMKSRNIRTKLNPAGILD